MSQREKLKNKYSILVLIDLLMMILLIINLSLILFDWIFAIPLFNNLFHEHTPGFYGFYNEHIHLNFVAIDLKFVSVFLAEFVLSWIISVVQKEYHKWFFYPFLHWYDLLGCIPVGSFRFLRILRVFSILIRLQNLKIIDLTNTYMYSKYKKYYGILVEEISDRVVVNILEGVQDEISSGGPVVENIINDVIRPKQDLLVEWISRRLEYALQRDVLARKEEIENYVTSLISEGLRKNNELKTIEQVPIMGKFITEIIEDSISNIINNIIGKALTDLASYKNRELINNATNAIINSIEYQDSETRLNEIFTEISVEVLEVIKKEVQIQKWKLKEEQEEGANATEKTGIEFLLTDRSKT